MLTEDQRTFELIAESTSTTWRPGKRDAKANAATGFVRSDWEVGKAESGTEGTAAPLDGWNSFLASGGEPSRSNDAAAKAGRRAGSRCENDGSENRRDREYGD